MKLKRGLLGLSVLSLAVCLAAPILYFLGRIQNSDYKTLFLIASAAWFITAGLYQSRSVSR